MPFKGADDVMRMVQVIDLVDGAGWYDMKQERANPPGGVDMHWSRLPDVPLAAALVISERLNDRETALILAARLMPPLFGSLFFLAFVWAAVPLCGTKRILHAGLVGMCLTVPLSQFSAGRIDHHGWQLLLAMTALGAVARAISCRGASVTALAGGVSGALGLWVGAEAIPWLGLVTAGLTLGWIRHGEPIGRSLLLFGLSLFGAVAALFPLALVPADWRFPACDAFSTVSLGIALVVCLFGIAARGADCCALGADWRPRLAVAAGSAVAGLATLRLLFPECAGGPFAQVSPEVFFWMDKVKESQPMSAVSSSNPSLAATVLVLPVSGLAVAVWRAVTTAGRHRTLWLFLGVAIAGAMGLQFWQVRGSFLANAFAGLPLAWLAGVVGQRAEPRSKLVVRLLLRAAPAAFVGLSPVLAGVSAAVLFGEGQHAETDGCDVGTAAQALNAPSLAKNGPLLIAAPIQLGPPILLVTPHQVLAAPYHRNTEGLRDIRRLLYSDEKSALEVVRRRGVDLILVCESAPRVIPEAAAGSTLFYDRLLSGQTPDWLAPVPFDGEARLYLVKHPVAQP
jgi:hypothetical protein